MLSCQTTDTVSSYFSRSFCKCHDSYMTQQYSVVFVPLSAAPNDEIEVTGIQRLNWDDAVALRLHVVRIVFVSQTTFRCGLADPITS